jgi:hypothetical protein
MIIGTKIPVGVGVGRPQGCFAGTAERNKLKAEDRLAKRRVVEIARDVWT